MKSTMSGSGPSRLVIDIQRLPEDDHASQPSNSSNEFNRKPRSGFEFQWESLAHVGQSLSGRRLSVVAQDAERSSSTRPQAPKKLGSSEIQMAPLSTKQTQPKHSAISEIEPAPPEVDSPLASSRNEAQRSGTEGEEHVEDATWSRYARQAKTTRQGKDKAPLSSSDRPLRSYPEFEPALTGSLHPLPPTEPEVGTVDPTYAPATTKAFGGAHIASTAIAASIHYLVSFGAMYATKVGLQAAGAPQPQLITMLSGPLHKYGEDLTKLFRTGAIAPAMRKEHWIKARARTLMTEDLPFFYFTALYILDDTLVRPLVSHPKESNGNFRKDNGVDIPIRLLFGMLAATLTALTVQLLRYMQGGQYKAIPSSERQLRLTDTLKALKHPRLATATIADGLGRGASLLPVSFYGIGHFSSQNLLIRNILPNVVLIGGWVTRSDLKKYLFEPVIKPFAFGISSMFESHASTIHTSTLPSDTLPSDQPVVPMFQPEAPVVIEEITHNEAMHGVGGRFTQQHDIENQVGSSRSN